MATRTAMLLPGFFLLCLAWLLPGHYFPWASAHQEFVAATGGILVATAAAGPSQPRVSRSALLILALALVPLIQGATGQIVFFSDALLASLYLFGFGLAIVTGRTLAAARRDDLLDALTAICVAGAVVSTGLAAFQWQHLSTLGIFLIDFRSDRPYANLAQPNQLATLIAWGVVGIWRWYEARRIRGGVAGLALVWLGFGLVMTQSRTAWLFVTALAASCLLMRGRVGSITTRASVCAGVASFALAVLGWGFLNTALDLDAMALAHRFEAGIRQVLWPGLLRASFEAPWFGYGWTQVGLAQQAMAATSGPVDTYHRESHNLLLDLGLWNGWPLALSIVAALVIWIAGQLRACRTIEHAALLLLLTAVGIHAMVEYPLEYAYFLLPAGIAVGAAEEVSGSTIVQGRWRMPFAVLLLALATLFFLIVTDYLGLERTGRDVRFRAARIGLSTPVMPEPDITVLYAELEYQRFIKTEPRSAMSADELQWFRDVARRNAFSASQFKLAQALAMNGQGSEATLVLVQLCKMHWPRGCIDARNAWLDVQETNPALRGVWPASINGTAGQ